MTDTVLRSRKMMAGRIRTHYTECGDKGEWLGHKRSRPVSPVNESENSIVRTASRGSSGRYF
jgi:hypothetical protein